MRNLIYIILFTQSISCFSQTEMSLTNAEEALQKNNLQLLAQQYNISVAQANVIQAKIWDLPYLSLELNAINPQNNTFFDVGKNGQKSAAIQQLIYLGGKKKNQIEFAKSNMSIAELEFEQLLRNLKNKLSQSYYSLYFDKQNVLLLENQIEILDTLIDRYQIQANKSNISLKEVVRLQSLSLNFKNERNSVLNNIILTQQDLSLLTGISDKIVPTIDENDILNKFRNNKISKDSAISSAINYNIEYLVAKKITENQELYYKWQKSLAIPDLTAGASYDQRGGAFQNQVNLTFGLPLALWNRNKGNIKMAEAQYKQTTINKDLKKIEIQLQIDSYWSQWQLQQKQFSDFNNSISQNINTVYNGVLENFKKRNISLLEFTDFLESYGQTITQINEYKKTFVLSGLNLNYITNNQIF